MNTFFHKICSTIKSNTFHKYICYFLVISFLSIILVSTALFFVFSDIYSRDAVKSAEANIAIVKNSQDFLIESIDKSVSDTISETEVVTFMEKFKENDVTALIDISNKLTKLTIINESIDSIAIFDINENYAISTNQGVVKGSDFHDINYIDELISQDIQHNMLEIRTQNVIFTDKQREILTFVKTVPLMSHGNPQYIAVVNVKLDYLKTLINTSTLDKKCDLFITGIKNELLYSTTDIINQSILAEIPKKDEDEKGYFQIEINNTDYIVSYIATEAYGWIYYYIMPLKAGSDFKNIFALFTIIISVVVLILSVYASFYISSKLYKPIKNIAGMFSSPDDPTDDIIFIEENVIDLIQKNKQFNKETLTKITSQIRDINTTILDAVKNKDANKNEELIANIKNHINENLHTDLSPNSLSEKFFISPSYMRKLFKDFSGETIKDYTIRMKMERAQQFLIDNKYSITEIAEKTGYLSVQAFTTAFKNYTSETPKEFRMKRVPGI